MDWLEWALAAINEGVCPEHRTRLGEDGWCPDCGHHGAWWSIGEDQQTVISRYPLLA